MTLVIAKPTGGKLIAAQTYVGIDDPDAAAYITAVEAADTAAGQSGGLETATKVAIHSFVKGCKADGIWPAIKASCILAGARTLNGALVPLVGSAPTNFNFVAGDYNRKTGLVGNGSTKYLNSNRANNADPVNSQHLASYETSINTTQGVRIGALGNLSDISQHNYIDRYFDAFRFSSRGAGRPWQANITSPFLGLSRSAANVWQARINQTTIDGPTTTSTATNVPANYFVFNRSGGDFFSSIRLSFYSIGESLDLAKLDTRVTDLMNAFGVAIP